MGNDVKKWPVICILLLLDFLSLSCSQVVAPVEGSTDCLKLHFFVRTGLGTIKYGLFESLRPNSDQEMSVSDLLDHEASGAVHVGSVPIEEEGRRISREVCKLKPGTAYDLYYVTETYGSNGLFSPVGSTMNITTHEVAPEIEDISVIACPGRADSIQLNMTLDGSSGGGGGARLHWAVARAEGPGAVLQTLGGGGGGGGRNAPLLPVSVHSPDDWLPGMVNKSTLELNSSDISFTIEGLQSDSTYKVVLVTERSAGVFGATVLSDAVRTHAPAPELELCVAAPLHGTTDAVTVTVELACDPPSSPSGGGGGGGGAAAACGEVGVELRPVRKEEDGGGPPRPGGAPKKQAPEEPLPAAAALLAFEGGPGEGLSRTAGGLAPNTTYAVLVRAQTPGGGGLFGADCALEVTTHALPPVLEHFNASRTATGTDSSGNHGDGALINYKLSSPGWLHIKVQEQLTLPAAVLGGQEGAQHLRTVTHQVREAAVFGALELEDLPRGRAFTLTAVAETSTLEDDLTGVRGQEVIFNLLAHAPEIVQLEAMPVRGTTDAIEVTYEVDSPDGEVIFFLVEVANDSKITDLLDGQAVVDVVEKWDKSSSFRAPAAAGGRRPLLSRHHTAVHEGFGPGTNHTVSLVAVSHSGIPSPVTQTIVQTHAVAPAVLSISLQPLNGSATALGVKATLDGPGTLHYLLAGAGEVLPGVETGYIVHKGYIEVEENGLASFSLDNLEPNTSYQLSYLTETLGAGDGPAATEVYGPGLGPAAARTHPLAPDLLEYKVRATDGTAEGLTVALAAGGPGLVHYAVRRAAAPPAAGGAAAAAAPSSQRPARPEKAGEQTGGHTSEPCSSCAYAISGLNETLMADVLENGTLEIKEDLTLVFQIQGLNASTEYDVCLCTEVAGAGGLHGAPAHLVAARTHPGPPGLAAAAAGGPGASSAAAKKAAGPGGGSKNAGAVAGELLPCAPDCGKLLRDQCWLTEDVCGECLEGYVGKRGHGNTPCGPFKPIVLTSPQGGDDEEPQASSSNLDPQAGSDLGVEELRSLNNTPEAPPVDASSVAAGGGSGGGGARWVSVPVFVREGVMDFVYVELTVAGGGRATDTRAQARGFCADQGYGGRDGAELLNCASNLERALDMQVQQQKFVDVAGGGGGGGGGTLPKFRVNVELPPDRNVGLIIYSGDDIDERGHTFCQDQDVGPEDCAANLLPLLRELNAPALRRHPLPSPPTSPPLQ